MSLAPYAADSHNSGGRRFTEPAPGFRSEFQRDRDRIVHSTAFRRLEYKTQVFVNHEGDLFRTRLTHSIEVAQIARSIARTLQLNEDLTEAVALAHDLGHTPYGHAGQDTLNQCMQAYGGFEHNLQSLRTVDELEERYAEFPGLNLMHETREGIIKHCSLENARKIGDVGRRFLENRRPSLEAQLCNLADEIAYNNHDVDDGLRSGVLSFAQLESEPLFALHLAPVRQRYPGLSERRQIHETVRRMINHLVSDLIVETRRRIEAAQVTSLEEVRQASPLVAFGEETLQLHLSLKRFLRQHLYQHYQVLRMTARAKRIVTDLFNAFLDDARLLPPQYQVRAQIDKARAVADYIAGMTDRYAMKEHRRLFAISES
jgi:dGTPase